MSAKVRITTLVTVEMKRAIVEALDANDDENFQRFVRKAITRELKHRGKDVKVSTQEVEEDENIPDWVREEAAQLARNQASLPRRSERKS
jgi:inhibitor of KinA sporulation pathway (predicted exonuclease)